MVTLSSNRSWSGCWNVTAKIDNISEEDFENENVYLRVKNRPNMLGSIPPVRVNITDNDSKYDKFLSMLCLALL